MQITSIFSSFTYLSKLLSMLSVSYTHLCIVHIMMILVFIFDIFQNLKCFFCSCWFYNNLLEDVYTRQA